MSESGLPAPSVAMAVIGTALLEYEIDHPGFLERMRRRAQSESLASAVVRLRGPRQAPETLQALEEAEAWLGAVCLIADATIPRKRKRA